jgi:hypothetical protein
MHSSVAITLLSLGNASAELKFCSSCEHLEHFTTPTGKRRALSVGTMTEITVSLGMGN